MSRKLSLNTSDGGGNQRYSFLATPLEMHAQGHQNGQQLPLPSDPETHEIQQRVIMEHPQRESTTRREEIQKVDQHQENSTPSPYANRPPPEAHPANYAPYADEMVPPEKHTTVSEPQYSYDVPPNSPGPLPVKVNPETIDRVPTGYSLAVAPDENPLHSPQIPQSPPPIPTTTTSVVAPSNIMTYHYPGQISHPNQGIKGGTWSHGLCDCSGVGTCCVGLLCPCILYGKTQHRLSMKSRKEDPTNMLGYEMCNGSCTAMALLCGCQCERASYPTNLSVIPLLTLIRLGLMATAQHTRTRKSYGIRGEIASDCVRATCCTCCTLIQDEKEIQKREEERQRATRESGIPYMAPGAMTYPPPPTQAPRR